MGDTIIKVAEFIARLTYGHIINLESRWRRRQLRHRDLW